MNSKTLSFALLLINFLFTTSYSAFGQNRKQLEGLASTYKQYSELSREVSYAHLNKTTFLNGEIMGFTAYVFDKVSKTPSVTATNVYCTISDENNTIIKSEM